MPRFDRRAIVAATTGANAEFDRGAKRRRGRAGDGKYPVLALCIAPLADLLRVIMRPQGVSGMRFLARFVACFLAVSGILVGGAAADPARPGQLYGRLKVPYTLKNETLPAGSYIILAFDAGDYWVVGDSYSLPYIRKSAVDVVPRTEFSPRPRGRITSPTTLYRFTPMFITKKDRSTLEQTEAFAINPTLRVGEEVSILAQEGDDYVVTVGTRQSGRVPVSSTTIIPGDYWTGRRIFIPPQPQPTEANTPSDVEPPLAQTTDAQAPRKIAPVPNPEPPKDEFALDHAPVQSPWDSIKTLFFYYLPWSLVALAGALILFAATIKVIQRVTVRRILFAVRRVTGLLTKAEKDYLKARKEYKALLPQISARFPRIYRVPDELRGFLKLSPLNPNLRLDEHAVDWWKQLLENYPAPPRSDAEQRQREEDFWNSYAELFTTTDADGQPALKPKQEILDYFSAFEKWIFRHFYAATGVVHKTIVENIVWLFVEDGSAYRTEIERKFEGSSDAYRRFVRETLPAHYKEWGEWFHFHIQEAFDRLHGTHDDYGAPSPTTPADHAANDGLAPGLFNALY